MTSRWLGSIGLIGAFSFLRGIFLAIYALLQQRSPLAANITVSQIKKLPMSENQSIHDLRMAPGFVSLKIRRSPHLVMYFHQGHLVFENYITRRRFQSNSFVCMLLSYFETWKTPSQVLRVLTDYTRKSVLETIQKLFAYGMLITERSEEDKLERKFKDEWLWPLASRYYHFSTKLDETYATPDQIRKYYEKNLKTSIQPPIYKSYPNHSRVRLITGGPDGEAPLFRTLRERKTVREFSDKPLSFRQLSRIIYYTWGRISQYKSRDFGLLLHKTSPSAGARHPIETYAVVNNVEGVKPGLYHYSVKDHSLELLGAGDFRERCVAYSAGQTWTGKASVLFIMTAVVARTSWKYRVPRAYRAFLLDAGHLSQSFLLTSNALGLGAFCIGIICDTLIEKELNLDGVTETALFAVGAGQPVKRNRPTAQTTL